MILPPNRADQIEFFEKHLGRWEEHMAQIGLAQEDIDQIKLLTTDARTAYTNAQLIRDDSRSATNEYYGKTAKMRSFGASLLATIKAYAEKTNDPSIYSLANIPPPAPPAPLPAPERPDGLRATIDEVGLMKLTWKAPQKGHSSGILFLIARRRVGEPTFTVLTGVQEPVYSEFIGSTCAGALEYRVQAVRGDKASDWSSVTTVNFVGGETVQQNQAEAA